MRLYASCLSKKMLLQKHLPCELIWSDIRLVSDGYTQVNMMKSASAHVLVHHSSAISDRQALSPGQSCTCAFKLTAEETKCLVSSFNTAALDVHLIINVPLPFKPIHLSATTMRLKMIKNVFQMTRNWNKKYWEQCYSLVFRSGYTVPFSFAQYLF